MLRMEESCFVNSSGMEISINRYFDDTFQGKLPLVIFSHGFKGFKDWGGFPYLLEKIAGEGYICASFNFSLNGIGKGSQTEFTRLDLFAENTFTRELDDLGEVIDYFYDKYNLYGIDKNRIALVGHSRGGGISVLKAKEDRRIKALITLASVSGFNRYTPEMKKKWKEKGYLEVENTRTKQIMRMNFSLIEDLERNHDRLDIMHAMGKLDIPALIIHGGEDLSVSPSEAQQLFESSNRHLSEVHIIENTGHTFGTVHPFQGTTPAFETVIEKIILFLRTHL